MEGSMKDPQIISIPWMPKNALDGMLVLDAMEELAYRRICDLIYVTEDNLPDDDKKLAWMTKTGRQWKRIKASLIALGKIAVSDHKIRNAKCTETIQKTRQLIQQKQNAGKASSDKRKLLEKHDSGSTDVDIPLEHNDERVADGNTNEGGGNVPTNHKPIASSKEDGGVGGAPSLDARYINIRQRIVGLFPELDVKDASIIHAWLAEADMALDILPQIDLAKAQKSKPSGFGYFTPMITRAKEARLTPLPKGKPNGSANYGRKTKSQAADDAMRDALTDLGIVDRAAG
jgi:uncharacterized protein YdaU (DUF1376 family)